MNSKPSLTYYADLISKGDVVAFPTETVYGLGADARNPSAIQKIFTLKGRPADNPLIVHISDRAMLKEFAVDVPNSANLLMDAYWPGPLTLVLKRKSNVLDLITAGLDTVAIRMPNHKTALELISQTGPLVAPSANKSGRPSPTMPDHVRADFGNDIAVIEDKPTQIGLESTVINLTEKPFRILRPGAITRSQIESVIKQQVNLPEENTKDKAARSPGMKYSHYAPEASVRWIGEEETNIQDNTLYLLHTPTHSLIPDKGDHKPDHVVCYYGDYQRFARELYDRFRQADTLGLKSVAIEPFTESLTTEEELTFALRNRISKAIIKHE